MIDEISAGIRNRRLILFVGSGVSRTIGLPSWGQIIDEMGKQLGFDPIVFRHYAGFLELAEYYEAKVGSLGTLRSWMDRTWHRDESRVDSSKIHNAIVDLNFPLIYTTNYDRWLEIAFARRKKEFRKIANVGDFANASDDIANIVKLHGDFDNDKSLVLTERSYFERLEFDSPLDIKLRSDSIGKGILFIGYSLSDINIRFLLYKLHKLWSDSLFAIDRPKSYMFLTRPNPIQEEVLRRRGIHAIVSDLDDPEAGLATFLEAILGKVASTSI